MIVEIFLFKSVKNEIVNYNGNLKKQTINAIKETNVSFFPLILTST